MQETFQKERIQALLTDESLRETVRQTLKSQGIPFHTPCLKVEVTDPNNASFLIEKSDFLKVFSYFGDIKDIKILGNVALILFKDLISAFFAQKIFNGKEIPELNVILTASWYYNNDEQRIPLQELRSDSAQKFTARFDIQIENDKEFQVARRLIGPKGVNMKNIVEKCCQGMTGPVHDIVKLRLRGRGSGFKEGPDKMESEENLHICISSKYNDRLQIAVEEIERLVLNVYQEYYAYRAKKNLGEVRLNLKKTM